MTGILGQEPGCKGGWQWVVDENVDRLQKILMSSLLVIEKNQDGWNPEEGGC